MAPFTHSPLSPNPAAGASGHRAGIAAPFQSFVASCARHPQWSAPLLGAVAACGFRPLALWPLALLGVAGLFALVARAEGWRPAARVGDFRHDGDFSLTHTPALRR